MKSILKKSLTRRCPRCHSVEVRRSNRKSLYEIIGLRLALTRPYRCETCGGRYYGFSLQRRISLDEWNGRSVPRVMRVSIYGCGKDNEPFREDARMRLANAHSAVLSLSTDVELGQKLVVFMPSTEEDEKCEVAFIAEKSAGKRLIGIIFDRPAWEFLSISTPVSETKRKAIRQ